MHYKKVFLIIFSVFLIAGCSRRAEFLTVNIDSNSENTNLSQPPLNLENSTTSSSTVETVKKPIQKQEVRIPASRDLLVPFASQAPLLNWDTLHEETCEEASMILASFFYAQKDITPQLMEDELQKIVSWEQQNGYKVDLTAEETVKVLNDYFGLSARVERNPTVDKLKYEISSNHLILVPAAGRTLGNPYFTGIGPIYHMFVIRGYDDKNFITNDVGTRRGEKYKYAYETLMNSVHDWNHDLAQDGMTDQEIVQGDKVVIVIDGPVK